MGVSSGSRSRVAFIAEVTEGTTPSTPTFQTFRRTGGGLMTRKTTEPSGEIQPDRNVRSVIQLGQYVEGSYDFEFSHATLDAFLEAVTGGAWTTNVLGVGAAEKFFTFEELDVAGATNLFSRFVASRINTLDLNFRAEQKVTGSIGVMGRQESLAAVIITGATYTAANTEPVETGVTLALSQFLGVTPLPDVRGIRLNINAGLQRNMKLGSLYPVQPTVDQCVITGELDVYFDDNAVYNLALNHSAGQLQFTIGGTANKKYTFNMPSARILAPQRVRGGNGQPVMCTLPFQAEGNSGSSSLSVTRLVA